MRYPTLYDQDEIDSIVNTLVSYWNDENMIQFVKQANDLYDKFGEYQADDLMLKVRRKIGS
jgi:hypothetical protein